MNRDKNMGLSGGLFGRAYEQDERIRAATDKAGYHGFLLLMAVMYLCMTAGSLLEHSELSIISCVFFLLGCISYLFFMVKGGAISFSAQFFEGKSKMRLLFWVVAGGIFGILDFSQNVSGNLTGQMTTIDIAWMSLVKALQWIVLMLILFKVLSLWSEKRVEKKIKEAEEKGI